MAGYLPEMQFMDAAPVLSAYRAGNQMGQEDVQRNILRDVGQAAATQGLGAASNVALQRGDVATGVKLGELSIDRQTKMYDFLGRAAIAADTPEKWTQYVGILSKQFGPESVKGFENFSSRESAILLSKNAFETARQQKATEEFGRAITGQPMQPAPAMQGAPSAVPSRAEVMPSARVWGDKEAEKAGLYPSGPSPVEVAGTPRAVSQPSFSTAPAAVPPASFVDRISPLALVHAVSNPALPTGQKEVAKMLLAEKIKTNPEIAKLEAFRRDPSLMQMAIDLKKAGATAVNVNTNEGFEQAATKARISVDTETAKEVAKQAALGQRMKPLLNQVIDLADKTPGGWAGKVSATMSRAFSGLGLPVSEGMSNAELLQSISQRMIPVVREPGPTSEKEIEIYLRAVPGLMQSADGRKKVAKMTESIINRSIEIAKVYRTNIGAPDLYDRLAALDKPIIPDAATRQAIERAAGGEITGRTKTNVPYRIVP